MHLKDTSDTVISHYAGCHSKPNWNLQGQFFVYIKIYKGSDINDVEELGWFIPRKRLDLSTMLDS